MCCALELPVSGDFRPGDDVAFTTATFAFVSVHAVDWFVDVAWETAWRKIKLRVHLISKVLFDYLTAPCC
jgi:hypothetical protein